MKIFVCEYVSGGGFKKFPDFWMEGYAMLYALVSDFSKVSKVFTIVDERLKNFWKFPNTDFVRGDFEKKFENLVEKTDATLVVAPETENTLYNLTRIVEEKEKFLLGCKSEGVKIAQDKKKCQRILEKAKIPTPKISSHEFPIVAKPRDGVGCSEIFLLNGKEQKKIFSEKKFIFQKYIDGIHASVSLLVSKKPIPISLNKQNIEIFNQRFFYRGGYVPLNHPLKKEAFEVSKKCCEAIKGLRGYVGVDIVLRDKAYVIEVNPRITTSYVGLRKVLKKNLAELILMAFFEKDFFVPEIEGKASFGLGNKDEEGIVVCNGKNGFFVR